MLNEAKIPNLATTTCLRPRPETLGEFQPLWDARNEAFARKDRLIEAAFAAAGRKDQAAYEQLVAQADQVELEIQALSAQMLPLQFKAWERTDANVVTNVGRNDILDKYWRGSGYTQTVVMGLKGTGAPAAGDTQASHASWLEVGGANAPTYTGNRKAVTMGAAASQSCVSPQQTFAITSTGTVSGLFMNNGGSATKDDTTGVLVSAVNFTGGDEAVNNLDSLLVTYTFNA
ncbi:MAG: hypothetical protein AB7U98_13535 [Candidatus Nitrosocosmicus sp.]